MDIKHGISMVSYIVLEDRLLCMPMVTKIGTFMAYNIEDGPAFEASNGYREWWINGEELTEDEFNSYLAKKKLNELLQSDLQEKASKMQGKI